MLKRILSISLFTIFVSVNSYAASMSGNGHELLEQCNAAKKIFSNQTVPLKDHTNAGICLGFIRGISEMGDNMTGSFCSKGSTLKDKVFIVLNFIERNKSYLSSSAGMFVVKALEEKYPCR